MMSHRAKSSSTGSRHWVSGFPALVAEWDAAGNGDLSPDRVTAGSGRRLWWICPRGPDHRWRASANNRTTGETGCPFCANRRVSVTNDLATLHPDIAAEWDAERNGAVPPSRIVATTTRIAWWRCARDESHVWRAAVRDRTRDLCGCPYCARRLPSAETSLAATHPQLAREWHPTQNGELGPGDLLAGSSRAVWWRCAREPAHCWRALVVNRTSRASGCPYCAATGSAKQGDEDPNR